MKKILSIAGIALLSSCTKDAPSVHSIKVSFFNQSTQNAAYYTDADTMFVNHWGWQNDFEAPKPNDGIIDFVKFDEYDEAVGNIFFACTFYGSTLKDGTYTGTGTWHIKSADGQLSKFNNGSGSLTYKEVKHDKIESEFSVEMVGVGWK